MILDQIVLHNFGVFRGRQKIALAPPSSKSPITLFGGLNGAGKTTLLNGLLVGLYGRRAPVATENGGYDEFLRGSIHRGVKPSEGARIEIRFRSVVEGKERRYCVCRSWSVHGKSVRKDIDVFVDDSHDRTLSETWSEQVDRFMPARLAALYFFDGERIESFADTNKAADMLKDALHALFGVDLAQQLEVDLRALERRKISADAEGPEKTQIEAAEGEFQKAQEDLAEHRQQVAAHRAKRDRAQEKFNTLDREYGEAGGDLLEGRQGLEQEHVQWKEKVVEIGEDLRGVAEGGLPLSLVRGLLDQVGQQADREGKTAQAEVLHDTLVKRDAQLLAVLDNAGATTESVEAAQKFFEEHQTSLSEMAQEERYLNLSDSAQANLKVLLASGIDEELKRVGKLVDRSEEIMADGEAIEGKLALVPDDGALATLIEDREKARVALETYENEVRKGEFEEEDLQRRCERTENALNHLLDERGEAEFQNQDSKRFVQHSSSLRDVLARFRESVISLHLGRLEGLILECYQSLLRKKSLVSSMKIEPETYELKMVDKDGQPVLSERLSAGERQLLAVAILWGLARASGRSLPTAVDTPLGRLDASHRKHLVERYFPYASNQVLILSTDEEIDEGHFKKLKNRIGHAYRLDYDDETASTTVQPGYFW